MGLESRRAILELGLDEPLANLHAWLAVPPTWWAETRDPELASRVDEVAKRYHSAISSAVHEGLGRPDWHEVALQTMDDWLITYAALDRTDPFREWSQLVGEQAVHPARAS
mgnify:CR=1 FL=1